MITGPTRKIVKRLLGSNRRAVKAEHEDLCGRTVLAANHGVVKPGQQDLTRCRSRDDRLYGCVILGGRFYQLLHARKQLISAELADIAGGPVVDDPAIARMRVRTPASLNAQRPP